MQNILVVVNAQGEEPGLPMFVKHLADNGLVVQVEPGNLEGYASVITVDYQKGYTVSDVLHIAEKIKNDSSKVYMGSQPKQTRGQKILSNLFWFIQSKRILDIQSSLRGYPVAVYESIQQEQNQLNALIEVVRQKVPIEEVALPSSSLKPNKSSLEDIWILFRTFFKYVLSSFASFLVDISLFQLMIFTLNAVDDDFRILAATAIARVVSSVVNFLINKHLVFQNKGDHKVPAVKYFTLVVVEMVASGLLVTGIYRLFRLPETLIKLVVDLALFFTGYLIEKVFIFDRD